LYLQTKNVAANASILVNGLTVFTNLHSHYTYDVFSVVMSLLMSIDVLRKLTELSELKFNYLLNFLLVGY